MGLFRRKKKKSLSETQGVPDDTFRCDVCRFIQPVICLFGSVVDTVDDLPSETYIVCVSCAKWLGYEEYSFPQGLCFNFTEEQRKKIEALKKEFDVIGHELKNETLLSIGLAYIDKVKAIDEIHYFLSIIPNARELIQLRLSILPPNIIDLSDRLTRGELVEASEIEKANKV